ncbi:MAG TPA: YihY/virulence factor BrkB family protein [Polyangiaceae bacterium]|nr:YihY/virulence factor BrkB family protein [Polyangiaceae bacterium]
MTSKGPLLLLKETAAGWEKHDAARLAAALSYYTLLSLAPVLVIAVTIVGLAFGEDAARGHLASEIGAVVGPQAARSIEAVIANARAPSRGILSSAIGVIVLLLGASGVFGELQSSLNTIWSVEPKPGRGISGVIRDRFFSFTMVLGVAFLLLVSLIVSAALSAVGHVFSSSLPGGDVLWQVLNVAFSIVIITLLFALIFKVVPDIDIQWRDVWLGAFVTALLFSAGKFLLALYLGRAGMTSSYGAAGSLVALAAWVYYAAQILFLGAEFTQVHANQRGSRVKPSENAVSVDAPDSNVVRQ